jgi:predicted double-glycine peptidase
MFQQVGSCGASSVTTVLQQMSSNVTGTSYTPAVMAIGW